MFFFFVTSSVFRTPFARKSHDRKPQKQKVTREPHALETFQRIPQYTPDLFKTTTQETKPCHLKVFKVPNTAVTKYPLKLATSI